MRDVIASYAPPPDHATPPPRAAVHLPMTGEQAAHARAAAEAVYRAESRRVFATLIRLLGDFDLAEEALHDAFRAALEQWPRDGVPANPRAWLVSAGRFKAIDGIRRRARFDAIEDVAEQVEAIADDAPASDDEGIEDDRLRLVFTCCHPALSPDAQVALTLREVCGLTTEEIAQAFLSSRADARAAHRAGEGEDPRRAHPLPGADARPSCRSGSTACCASSTSCSTRAIRRRPASR